MSWAAFVTILILINIAKISRQSLNLHSFLGTFLAVRLWILLLFWGLNCSIRTSPNLSGTSISLPDTLCLEYLCRQADSLPCAAAGPLHLVPLHPDLAGCPRCCPCPRPAPTPIALRLQVISHVLHHLNLCLVLSPHCHPLHLCDIVWPRIQDWSAVGRLLYQNHLSLCHLLCLDMHAAFLPGLPVHGLGLHPPFVYGVLYHHRQPSLDFPHHQFCWCFLIIHHPPPYLCLEVLLTGVLICLGGIVMLFTGPAKMPGKLHSYLLVSLICLGGIELLSTGPATMLGK